MISNYYYIAGRKITQDEQSRSSKKKKKKKKAKLFMRKKKKKKEKRRHCPNIQSDEKFLWCFQKSSLLETSPYHTVNPMRNPNKVLTLFYIDPKYLLDFVLHKIEVENLRDTFITRLDWKLRNQRGWLRMFWPVSSLDAKDEKRLVKYW